MQTPTGRRPESMRPTRPGWARRRGWSLMTMPPIPLEYLGRELVARFLRAAIFRPRIACRPVPTRANGQPALVMYVPDSQSGIARATGVLVFTLSGSRVSAITRFDDTVLPRFGVPATLPG